VPQVSCGGDHTVLVTRAGEVFTCGRGLWGQTGHGHVDNTCYLQRVEALAAVTVLQARDVHTDRQIRP
jgi:alpha-tubulin suppressor-like RCC1 family protein